MKTMWRVRAWSDIEEDYREFFEDRAKALLFLKKLLDDERLVHIEFGEIL